VQVPHLRPAPSGASSGARLRKPGNDEGEFTLYRLITFRIALNARQFLEMTRQPTSPSAASRSPALRSGTIEPKGQRDVEAAIPWAD